MPKWMPDLCISTIQIARWVFCLCGASTLVLIYLLQSDTNTSHIVPYTASTSRVSMVTNITAPVLRTDDEVTSNERFLDIKALYSLHGVGVYIYSAHWDDRGPGRVVRIFGLRLNTTSLQGYQCVLNSPDGTAAHINATSSVIYKDWPKVFKYYAFMIACDIASGLNISSPGHVTITSVNSYHVTIPIRYPRSLFSEKRELAVCVKPIHGQFDTVRLLEWFEIQKAVGITDFILFNADLYGASRYVVDYYQQMGNARVVSFPFLLAVLKLVDRDLTLGARLRYSLYQQVYLLALQECVYRFSNSYHFVMVIDLDEVILPTKDESIPTMFRRQRAKNPDVSSYLFPTAWHFREFRNETSHARSLLYMQTYAVASPPNIHQPKSIISTKHTITLNYHVALTSYSSRLIHQLPWRQYGYVHHFRDGTCHGKFSWEPEEVCRQMQTEARVDSVVKRYELVTLKRVYTVMKYLQL